jgi:hypothetical protein
MNNRMDLLYAFQVIVINVAKRKKLKEKREKKRRIPEPG